jgi:hypothetical protein
MAARRVASILFALAAAVLMLFAPAAEGEDGSRAGLRVHGRGGRGPRGAAGAGRAATAAVRQLRRQVVTGAALPAAPAPAPAPAPAWLPRSALSARAVGWRPAGRRAAARRGPPRAARAEPPR